MLGRCFWLRPGCLFWRNFEACRLTPLWLGKSRPSSKRNHLCEPCCPGFTKLAPPHKLYVIRS